MLLQGDLASVLVEIIGFVGFCKVYQDLGFVRRLTLNIYRLVYWSYSVA